MRKTFQLRFGDKLWLVQMRTLIHFENWTLALIRVKKVDDEVERTRNKFEKEDGLHRTA